MNIHPTKKPVLQALAGQPVRPLPVWLMRQAGRYLPEYRQLRSQAGDFLTLCFTPELAAEVTLQPIRRFGFDAAILFSDILVIPHALGQKLWFAEGEGPKLAPLDAETISQLKTKKILSELSPVFETLARVKSQLPDNVTLLGFAGAPWTVANYMIAGGSSDESIAVRKFAYSHPDALNHLIGILVESTTAYLIAQIEAGAEAVQIFESWASTIPEPQLQAYSISPIRQMIDGIRNRFPGFPVIVFPRGAGMNYPRYAKETGATAISVDGGTSLFQLSPHAVLQGNLDPVVLTRGGRHLENAVASIMQQTAQLPHIFNLGHGIRPETPTENVEHLLTLIRKKS